MFSCGLLVSQSLQSKVFRICVDLGLGHLLYRSTVSGFGRLDEHAFRLSNFCFDVKCDIAESIALPQQIGCV